MQRFDIIQLIEIGKALEAEYGHRCLKCVSFNLYTKVCSKWEQEVPPENRREGCSEFEEEMPF